MTKDAADIFNNIITAVFDELNVAQNTLKNDVSSKAIRDSVSVLLEPEIAKTHYSPSLVKNTMIAALGSAVISYLVFFLLYITDTIIRDPEDIKENINGTLIGVIPVWERDTSK